jgi:hypothetical protein
MNEVQYCWEIMSQLYLTTTLAIHTPNHDLYEIL